MRPHLRTRISMFASVALAACLGTIGLGAHPAAAQDATLEVGTLTCNVAGGGSFIVGSTKSLDCKFTGLSGKSEHYRGSISKIGLDLGVTGGGVIVWTVFAAAQDLGPGALAGSYSGLGAEAAVGIGAGAKVLVGGSQRSISLQPLSVQGNTGLNVAIAVETMTLHTAP